MKHALRMLPWIGALTCAGAPAYVEDFETGTGGAFSYHKAPDDVRIERVEGQAASGNWHLRGALPGRKRLEGYAVTATGLAGARLATVTARVRGRGAVWLCLISGNGWLYAPATTSLGDRWQEVSLAKVLAPTDTSLGIHFISRDVQPGAVFDVDRVQVRLAPDPPAIDTPVGPWRFEAEDFTTATREVTPDAQALGGRALRSDRHVAAEGMPVPQTRRPLHIVCRVKSGSPDDAWRLVTRQGGTLQHLQQAKPARVGEWEWVRFRPVRAGELGDRFGVSSARRPDAGGNVALDSVALATQPGLDPKQLSAAPDLLGRRPMAAVGRGLPGSGVVLGGFVRSNSTLPAEAPTTARVSYDDACLNLRFECAEPLLETARQRRHEFLARATGHDEGARRDDCVLILLRPRGSATVRELTVNALGAVADAAGPGSDPRGARDPAWDSHATARARIEEGRWAVDIAIPWSDLGGRPAPGDTWDACLGRSAPGRNETSQWNPSAKGPLDLSAPGAFAFVDSAPDIRLSPPASLRLRGNEIPPVCAAPGGGLAPIVFTEIRSPGAIRRVCGNSFDLPDAATGVTLAHGVLDAGSLQPLLLTAPVQRAVVAASAQFTLATDGPWELLVNGRVVAGDARAPAGPVRIPLEKGANVLALRLARGSAALRCEMGGLCLDAAHWRMAPTGTADPTDPGTDDGAWPVAPRLGDHATLGTIAGRPAGPVVLRRTLLLEHTRIWPTPTPAYTLARGVAQHIVFRTEGLKGRKLDGWETFIGAQPGIEVVGATGFYAKNHGIPRWTVTQLGERTVQGRTLRVAGVAADQPLVAGRHPIMSEFQAFVRVSEGAGVSVGPEAELVHWSEAEDGNVVEAPQSVPVRVLSAVAGARCDRFVWQLWGGWLSNMDDRAMRERVLECAGRAGFNDIVSGDRWTSDNAPRFGLKHTLSVSFQPWSLDVAPHLRAHPDLRMIKDDGRPSERHMCTSALLAEGWDAVRAALRERLAAIRPHTVDYDFEYPPFTGPHSCWCPRCLDAFRRFAGVPDATPLDPPTIAKRHRECWVNFMANRVAKMFALFRCDIHEIAPGTLFSVYSGYATPDNAERYGVDWCRVGEERGCDRAGCGYGRPADALRATIDALRDIPLLCGVLLTPYERDNLAPVAPLTKARLLRAALDATGGVLIYERTEMDGRSWLAMGETTRLVAAHEDVFLHGQRFALDGLDDAQVEAVRHGATTLVCMMNVAGNRSLALRVPLPPGYGPGRTFYGGRETAEGDRIEITLEPGGTEAVVLRKPDAR